MRASRRAMLRYGAAAGVSLLLPACRPAPAPRPHTQTSLREGALRLELRHFISNGDERFALARIRFEPSWPGPNKGSPDAPDWGDYRLSLFDPAGGALIFRAGFDSNLDRNAASAATQISMRIPLPERAVDAVIERRRTGRVFHTLWNGPIDPGAEAIDRSSSAMRTRVDTMLSNGEPAAKADIAILGDGYVESQYGKFVADARRACDYLFSVDPFRKRVQDFNVRAVFVPSPESGVTDPYLGLQKSTVFRCAYSAGDSERTLAVGDDTALREAASAVPYDFLLVIANARRYGGSAYFGGPAVVS
ncbi:MAG TPA: M64 family metallopeptidase, partial [Burkholderiales bacterium]|nr:M64 family metallopeptidase [Burkholderiales bacterium]